MYTSVINIILTKVRIFINYFLFMKQNVQDTKYLSENIAVYQQHSNKVWELKHEYL